MNKFWQMFTRLCEEVKDLDDAGGSGVSDDLPDDLQDLYEEGDEGAAAEGKVEKKEKPAEGDDKSGEGKNAGDGEGGDHDLPDDLKEVVDTKPAKKDESSQQTLKLDPETIALIRGQAGTAAGNKAAAGKMSPEEVEKILNPVKVSADMLKGLGFEEPTDEQVKAFQMFAEAIVKNSTSVSRVLLQQAQHRYESELSPVMNFYAQQEMQQTQTRFFSKYPSLKAYEKLIPAATKMVQVGDSDNEDAVFKKVAQATLQILKSTNTPLRRQQANPDADGGEQVNRGVPAANKFAASGRSGTSGAKGMSTNNPDADIYASE